MSRCLKQIEVFCLSSGKLPSLTGVPLVDAEFELPKFSFLGTRKLWTNRLKRSWLKTDDLGERKEISCYLFSIPPANFKLSLKALDSSE